MKGATVAPASRRRVRITELVLIGEFIVRLWDNLQCARIGGLTILRVCAKKPEAPTCRVVFVFAGGGGGEK